MRSFRLYWPALVVAMIVSFLFEAAWFSYFMNGWLAGIGRTMDWLHQSGMNPAVQYATAMICAFVMASVLSIAIQASGEQTIKRGIVCAAVLWLGFVATSWATEYIFEVRTLQIYGINVGYCLIDMMLMGAIVGGWKGKPRGV
ncbi:MAG TPA: DUF1761 domain-containing protein [Acidobacteriaceae bacterium]|nr:DUF1761 domain-containing protein [Acidobacteriaceae bacterium]